MDHDRSYHWAVAGTRAGRRGGRWIRRRSLCVGGLAVLALLACNGTPADAATGRAHQMPVGPEIEVRAPLKTTIAPGFVGLTFEATSLGSAYLDPTQSNLPALLDQLGGTGDLRFGGQTSDLNAAWLDPATDPLPAWSSFGVTPADLATVGSLAEASGWSVDLGVNLLEYDPATAVDEVRTAEQEIGPSLRAVEIGNEPDLYFYFLAFLNDPPGGIPTTFPDYQVNWNAYVAAIRAAGLTVPINGPDFYLTNWLGDITKQDSKPISGFTQHFYPLADCGGAVLPPSELLAPTSITSEESLITTAEAAIRSGHHPLILDEFNSISCGSSSPAAYEFDSSLWAVHALLDAAAKGVASVNIQMDPGNCNSYSPLCVPDPSAPGTLETRPIFQGMQLVSQLEGSTFLKTAVKKSVPLPAGVSEYALRGLDGRVAIVVDNTTSSDVTGISVNVDPTATLVSTELLSAPSLTASTGVTLTSTTPASPATSGLVAPADSAVVFTLAP